MNVQNCLGLGNKLAVEPNVKPITMPILINTSYIQPHVPLIDLGVIS